MCVDEGTEGVEVLGEEGHVLFGEGLGVCMGGLLDDPLIVVNSPWVVLLLRLDVSQIHVQVSEGLEDGLNKDFGLEQIRLCSFDISSLQAEGPIFIVLEASQQVWVCSSPFFQLVLGVPLSFVHEQLEEAGVSLR